MKRCQTTNWVESSSHTLTLENKFHSSSLKKWSLFPFVKKGKGKFTPERRGAWTCLSHCQGASASAEHDRCWSAGLPAGSGTCLWLDYITCLSPKRRENIPQSLRLCASCCPIPHTWLKSQAQPEDGYLGRRREHVLAGGNLVQICVRRQEREGEMQLSTVGSHGNDRASWREKPWG